MSNTNSAPEFLIYPSLHPRVGWLKPFEPFNKLFSSEIGKNWVKLVNTL